MTAPYLTAIVATRVLTSAPCAHTKDEHASSGASFGRGLMATPQKYAALQRRAVRREKSHTEYSAAFADCGPLAGAASPASPLFMSVRRENEQRPATRDGGGRAGQGVS